MTEMSSTMIEYINGIKVIKAYNQDKQSYARLCDKVCANAQYYYDRMRRSQLGMAVPIIAAFNFVGTPALVGPSGSGESMLAKLMAGFRDIRSGEITMGVYDLRKIPLPELYDRVAFVSQEKDLFDDTVRENIRMGVSVRATPRWKPPCPF